MAYLMIKTIIFFNKQCYKSKKNDLEFRITKQLNIYVIQIWKICRYMMNIISR